MVNLTAVSIFYIVAKRKFKHHRFIVRYHSLCLFEMSQSKVFLIFFSVALVDAFYIANPGENEIDNANTKYDEIRANFIHLATKVAGMEQRENVYYEQIIASLIDFWGLHRSLSLEINFKPDQLVDLIATFYRVTKLKTELLQRLLIALYDLRTGKPIEMKRLTQLPNLVACLQEFSVCINAEVIANRLSSPQVGMVVDAIESLLPYAELYASDLDECVSNASGGEFSI